MGHEKSLQGLEQEAKIKKCPDCGSKKVGYKNGENYCEACGLILD
ncbi:MAG: TFIIB-type zinc ribbon-containing protein [archaeon]